MKRVLVGVDESEASIAALQWAAQLAGRVDGEIIAANVCEPSRAEMSPPLLDLLLGRTEERIAALCRPALESADVSFHTVVLTGTPTALLDAAEREDADLLVVGQRGGGGFAGLHLGSVAHHLAHSTSRPLAIVPEPGARAAPGTIVLGVDGSPGSRAAVDWCTEVARVTKDEVVAVYAFEPFAEWLPPYDHDGWRRTAERLIDSDWVKPIRDAGVTVHTQVVQDIHPVVALATVAQSAKAGLIVVGASGIRGFVPGRLGRVPIQLANQTDLPVVLVPAAKRPNGEGAP